MTASEQERACECLCGRSFYLIATCLLQTAHQLLHRSVNCVVLLEVIFHSGEVCTPLSSLQKILKHKDTQVHLAVKKGDNVKIFLLLYCKKSVYDLVYVFLSLPKVSCAVMA